MPALPRRIQVWPLDAFARAEKAAFFSNRAKATSAKTSAIFSIWSPAAGRQCATAAQCLPFPRKQSFANAIATPAFCQKETLNGWSVQDWSRRSCGRQTFGFIR